MAIRPKQGKYFRGCRRCPAVGALRTSIVFQKLVFAILLVVLSTVPGLVREAQASIGGISLGGVSLSNIAVTLPTAIPTPTPLPSPVASIFAANPSVNSLSIFTVGSSGNARSLFAQTLLSNPQGIAYFGGNLYVVNQATDTITVYPANATGSVDPIIVIAGSNTQLNDPDSIVLDVSGNIYVSNRGSLNGNPDSINVYSAGSNGNVAPTAVITGPNTGLKLPAALALDSQRNIYVANAGSGAGGADTVTVYSAGSNGNSSPVRTISGSSTKLSSPAGIAVDSSGYLYVSSAGASNASTVAILIYAPGANGNVAPVTSVDGDCQALAAPGALTVSNGSLYTTSPGDLSTFNESFAVSTGVNLAETGVAQCLSPGAIVFGPNTQIDQPYGIAVDPAGNVYATDSESDSISVFPQGAGMNSLPATTIATTSNVINPTGVALDSTGNIYVANAGIQVGQPDSVNVYYAGSNANTTPYFVIGGAGSSAISGLSDPVAVAVSPGGRVYVANATAGYKQNGSISIYPQGLGIALNGVSGTSTSDITKLHDPVALALDSSLNLYVLNSSGGPDGAGSITVYAAAALTGLNMPWNIAPARTIANTATSQLTQFQSPAGMALAAGYLYVTNDGSISGNSDSITIYPRTGNGNIAPTTVISGANTGLNMPQGIAIDKNGYIYVANDGGANGEIDTITVYAPGTSGNAAPITTLSGSLTGLSLPNGIAVGP